MQAFSAQNVRHANRDGGLCKAGDILKQQHGDLLVSRQKLRQAEGITLVREKREAGNQLLGFATRPFVLCGLPIRRPPQSDLVYERPKRILHAPDHRPSRVWLAIWTGSTRTHFSPRRWPFASRAKR